MRKVTSSEMRNTNGGGYTCTTRVWKTNVWCAAWRCYVQCEAPCGKSTLTKSALGWHFLLAHGGGRGCTYTTW